MKRRGLSKSFYLTPEMFEDAEELEDGQIFENSLSRCPALDESVDDLVCAGVFSDGDSFGVYDDGNRTSCGREIQLKDFVRGRKSGRKKFRAKILKLSRPDKPDIERNFSGVASQVLDLYDVWGMKDAA